MTSQIMRFSIFQKTTNWFRNLSIHRKIVLIALIVLFILSAPGLSWRTSWFFKSKVCAMNGGTLARAGMAGKPVCVHPYPDGGKPCSSSEECIGGCVIYEPPILGQPGSEDSAQPIYQEWIWDRSLADSASRSDTRKPRQSGYVRIDVSARRWSV